MFTQEELLSALAEMGYDGDGTPDDVIQFLADRGEALTYGDEEVSDEAIRDILGEKADDEDEDDDEKSAPKIGLKKTSPDNLKKLNARLARLELKAARNRVKPEQRKGARHDAKHSTGDTPAMTGIRADRKSYERKIKNGTALYSSPEAAEISGAWFKTCFLGRDDAKMTSLLESHGFDVKAHTITNPTSAGNLIPTEFLADIVSNFEEHGVFRRHADLYQMSQSNTAEYIVDNDRLSIYRPGQNAAPSADSDLNFTIESLVARPRIATSVITNDMVSDSAIDVGERWGRRFVEDVALSEDQSGFLGDGTATYLGDIGLKGAFTAEYGATPSASSGSLYLAAANTHDTWSAITIDEINEWLSLIPVYADGETAIFCHKRFHWRVLNQLAHEQGGATYTERTGTQSGSFMGIPVHYVQSMPSTDDSTNGEIVAYAGSLRRAAAFGARQDVEIFVSDQNRVKEDALVIRGKTRDAINVHDVGDSSNDVAGPLIAFQTDA
jgi:HK97 family phage major capsid protein